MNKSAVIVGGGLGGLFTGAILSKEGLKVTVIEKNATVGGGLQSFSRFGEIFDTGMHVIGGMNPGGNIRRICDYLGITDRMHLKEVGPETIDLLYFAEDKRFYRIAKGRSEFVDSLAASFPDQRANLVKYMDAVYKIVDGMDMFFLRPVSDFVPVHSGDFILPVDSFIAKYISDTHLRSVLAYANPLYGGYPGKTPAFIHALLTALYVNGPNRFAGGSYLFAETLRDFIEKHGGEVVVGDAVVRVNTENRLVTSVITRKDREFKADFCICAIYPGSFFPLLDDASVLPKSYRTRLDQIPVSYSAFTLSIKLKKDTFRYMDYSAYYMERYDRIWDFGRSDAGWPLGFMYMTPPEIEQGEYASKMIVTAPMSWDYVKRWEDTCVGHRGKDYEEWKRMCAERILDCMTEIYPGFRDCVEAVNTASPLTIRDYYGIKEGSMCGYTKDCNNMILSQVPVVTKVKNLFLTGQNCRLHGFGGVPLTAINTCEAILGRNYVLDKINEFEKGL